MKGDVRHDDDVDDDSTAVGDADVRDSVVTTLGFREENWRGGSWLIERDELRRICLFLRICGDDVGLKSILPPLNSSEFEVLMLFSEFIFLLVLLWSVIKNKKEIISSVKIDLKLKLK